MPPKRTPEKTQASGPAAGTRVRSRSPEKTANTGHESSLSIRIESQNTPALPRRPSEASIASNAASDAASTQLIPGYFPELSPPEHFDESEPPITIVRRTSTRATDRPGDTPTPATRIPNPEVELSNTIKRECERGNQYKEQLLLVQKQAKKHLAALQTSRDQEVQDLQDELARLKAAQLEGTPIIARPRPQDTLKPENPFQVLPSPVFDDPQHLRVKAEHYKKLTEHHQPRDTDYNYGNINSNTNTRAHDYYKAYDPWEFSSPWGRYEAATRPGSPETPMTPNTPTRKPLTGVPVIGYALTQMEDPIFNVLMSSIGIDPNKTFKDFLEKIEFYMGIHLQADQASRELRDITQRKDKTPVGQKLAPHEPERVKQFKGTPAPAIASSLYAHRYTNTRELLEDARRVEEAYLETNFRYPRAPRNKDTNAKSTTNNNNSQPRWRNGNAQGTISDTPTTSAVNIHKANEKLRPTATKPAGWIGHWFNPEDRPTKLTEEERELLRKQGRCLSCRGSGHMVRDSVCLKFSQRSTRSFNTIATETEKQIQVNISDEEKE
ncbi:hypothetical protein BDW75DRAFT_246144 [Aspergillus navahoensis]